MMVHLWDNATYDAMAGAYQGQTPVLGCLALLSTMSEEKGLAFTIC